VLDTERPGTKIVCCDEYPHEGLGQWNILDAMRKDPALAKAVDVVSVHYPREKGKLTTPADATAAGKPLWSSEDQPESSASVILSRDWTIGGRSLAHLYNENFLEGHFTTEIWSPVTSYYDILAAPNSGLMYANTPWSGHYQVQTCVDVVNRKQAVSFGFFDTDVVECRVIPARADADHATFVRIVLQICNCLAINHGVNRAATEC
jgi:hypothetical protein